MPGGMVRHASHVAVALLLYQARHLPACRFLHPSACLGLGLTGAYYACGYVWRRRGRPFPLICSHRPVKTSLHLLLRFLLERAQVLIRVGPCTVPPR